MTESWYVIRLKPGANREAPHRRGETIGPYRRGETFGPIRPSIIERALTDAGLTCYVPMAWVESRNHRTHKKTVRPLPLITGYAFVRLTEADYSRARACDGVAGILGWNGRPWPVPDQAVAVFQTREASGEFYAPLKEAFAALPGRKAKKYSEATFKAGARVKPLDGAFAGYHGLVESVAGRGAVKVMIDLFGRLTPVEFEPDQLEIISPATPKAA
jgi:transcription antitermination factor NusG